MYLPFLSLFQVRPVITVRPPCDLLYLPHTITTSHRLIPSIAATRPAGGTRRATHLLPPHQMDPPPLNPSSSRTVGLLTAVSRWRHGKFHKNTKRHLLGLQISFWENYRAFIHFYWQHIMLLWSLVLCLNNGGSIFILYKIFKIYYKIICFKLYNKIQNKNV